jgi:hypothetical protein
LKNEKIKIENPFLTKALPKRTLKAGFGNEGEKNDSKRLDSGFSRCYRTGCRNDKEII